MRPTNVRSLAIASLAALAAAWIAAGAAAQDAPAAEPQRFYYADGDKKPLTVATEYLAVRLRPDADAAAFLEPGRRSLEALPWAPAETFPRQRIVLYQLQEGKSAEEGRLSRRTVTARAEVAAEATVFTTGDEAYLQILTDEFVARFRPEVTPQQIEELNARHGVERVRDDRYEANQLILRVTPASDLDALEAANLYHESGLTLWATPNFISEARKLVTPNDTHFGHQWHLENTGQGGGTTGEDVAAEAAWDRTLGNSTVVVAIVDDGVDYNHPDLSPNVFRHPGEIPGDKVDNDGNGYVDDVRGWDFYDDDNDPMPSTFNPPYTSHAVNDIHGTPCAGIAAARIGNSQGIAGAAGRARILPIKIFGGTTSSNFTTDSDLADAIRYAGTLADVLSNSWGHAVSTQITSAFLHAASHGRGGRGAVILVASGNGYSSSVGYPARLSTVIAVGASTNQGVRAAYSNYGSALDVVAPSGGGTRGIYTTDVSIAGRGYATGGDYYDDFGGTSAATPLAAGVAALVLSAHPTLTRAQVQDVLEDTADKIDAANAAYDATTGFSKKYGHGRIDAHAAVEEARRRRLLEVDVYARDSGADTGDTPSALPWWYSPDIKVDALGNQKVTSFVQIQHENPLSGNSNKVYVQVHNRGAKTAATVKVRLYWVWSGTGLPALPEKFWSEYPGTNSDTSRVHPLGVRTIKNLAPGAPRYVMFPWTAPALDPSQKRPKDHCLFAIVDSPQDGVFTRVRQINPMVREDNNVILHNVVVEELMVLGLVELTFIVENPYLYALPVEVDWEVDAGWEPAWEIDFDGYDRGEVVTLQPGEQRLMRLQVSAPTPGQEVELTVVQTRADTGETMGGVTYLLRSRERRWSLSLHAGEVYPRGAARRTLDDGTSLVLDLGYRWKPRWSVVGLLGLHRFDEKPAGTFDWLSLSANLRWDWKQVGRTTFYLGGGPGLYVPEAGSSKLGVNVGLGADVRLAPRLWLELGADSHHAFSSDLEFLQVHGGVIFKLR